MRKNEGLPYPICKTKTRVKVRYDTVLINFPLSCPKCKQKRRSSKLRPYTDCHIDLEIKNAEYHQQTLSDPLMILPMVRIRGFEPPPNCSDTDLNRARLPVPPYPRDHLIIHYPKIISSFFYYSCEIYCMN